MIKSKLIPPIKQYSAINSNTLEDLLFLLIDKKDKITLVINNIIAPTDISSIIVPLDSFNTCNEVITIKQMTKRLEEAFKI